jgi:hypothetical protein
MQWWYRGKPPTDAAIRRYVQGRKGCFVEGCDLPHHSNGTCASHRAHVDKDGYPRELVRPKREVPSYDAIHLRLAGAWGSASQYDCVKCGKTAREWAYDGTDPSQLIGTTGKTVASPMYYSQWPEFYMPMCVRCHRKMDAEARIRELTGDQFSSLAEYRLSKVST